MKVAQIFKFHFGLDRNISSFLVWSTTNIVKDNAANTKEVIKYREEKTHLIDPKKSLLRNKQRFTRPTENHPNAQLNYTKYERSFSDCQLFMQSFRIQNILVHNQNVPNCKLFELRQHTISHVFDVWPKNSPTENFAYNSPSNQLSACIVKCCSLFFVTYFLAFCLWCGHTAVCVLHYWVALTDFLPFYAFYSNIV